jgi:glycerol-3-phosphate dehydrogenase
MDDARLCLEVLRTASEHGLTAANYVEAVGFEKEAGRIVGVDAVDRLSGKTLTIRARQVLNATGPWGDAVRRLAGEETGPLLRPTKGVHLVAPSRGWTAGFLLLHPADGRVFFVLPWLGKTVIGTTDTESEESPDQLRVTAADVQYLLEGYNHYFNPPLREDDLLGRFVGARPLVKGNQDDPSALSREYHLSLSPSGLLTVSGGKYTTYRMMAETITDTILRQLGQSRRCRTRTFRLDGTPKGDWSRYRQTEVESLMRGPGLDAVAAGHLVNRYGRRVEDIKVLGWDQPELWQPIVAGEPDLRVEFLFHRAQEMAVLPEDYLLRRTRLGLFHPQLLQKLPWPLPELTEDAALEHVAGDIR